MGTLFSPHKESCLQGQMQTRWDLSRQSSIKRKYKTCKRSYPPFHSPGFSFLEYIFFFFLWSISFSSPPIVCFPLFQKKKKKNHLALFPLCQKSILDYETIYINELISKLNSTNVFLSFSSVPGVEILLICNLSNVSQIFINTIVYPLNVRKGL